MSATPSTALDRPGEGRPMGGDTDQVEQDAFAGGIANLLQIARTLEAQGDTVAGVVDILQPGALRERREVGGAGGAVANAVEEIAGDVADRRRTGADDLDLTKLARWQRRRRHDRDRGR